MTRRPLIACAALAAILFSARSSLAQQMGPVIGGLVTTAPVKPLSPENGVQVGDGVILHSGVGVEGGYDSNVFYNDEMRAAAALLRVTPFLDLTNTARNGEVPSGLFFDARAALTYREYISNDASVTQLRSFTPQLSATLEHNPRGSLALGLTESFVRSEEAPYNAGQSLIVRNNNTASAQLRWSPGGGRLQGMLRYTNRLDLFENSTFRAANSMEHEGMLDLSWRWLPKTALFLQVRQGYVGYLNDMQALGLTNNADQRKSNSFPLRTILGIRGLITAKTSISLALGYQNAFYSNGVSTSGFLGSTIAAAELVILPIFSTRIALGARHDFQNSVLGNFFYNDGVYASISQQSVGGLVSQLWGSYDYRSYYGVAGLAASTARHDNFVQAGAMLDYYLKRWAYAGLSYSLHRNQSETQPGVGVGGMEIAGVNYTKHQVFARLGVTY